jgi:hypothetical protein
VIQTQGHHSASLYTQAIMLHRRTEPIASINNQNIRS